MTAPPQPGPIALARLLAGVPAPLDPATLPEPWSMLARAVLAGEGGSRVAAFEAALAPLPHAAELRRLIFSIDPTARDVTLPLEQQAQGPWEHHELMTAAFPALEWTVHGLIPNSSLAMLGGKKKLGKSWFCLQLARAVALGLPLLGRPTARGGVLYICLEDGAARLQARLKRQQVEEHIDGLRYWFGPLPPLDGPGVDTLRIFIKDFQPRLLILDTLAAAKTGKADENDAGTMAAIVNRLRLLAQEEHCSILVVAHHRKSAGGPNPGAADAGDDIRGSSAIAAASDVNLGLYRTETSFVLRGEGRDIEDFALQLEFDREQSFTWQLIGDARVVARQDADKDLFSALDALGEADAGLISRELGKTRAGLMRRLKRLEGQGHVSSRQAATAHGNKVLYRAASHREGQEAR